MDEEGIPGNEEDEEEEYTPPEWLTPAHQRLRYLVREYYRAQRARIRAAHYLRRLEARDVEASRLKLFVADQKESQLWEGRRSREIATSLADFAVGPRLAALKGIGPVLAGGWIGELGPADRFAHPSAVWKYCGLSVGKDGWTIHAEEGEKRPFSRALKTLAWKTSKSFVMTHGPYRAFYDRRKQHEEDRKDWIAERLRERRKLARDKELKGVQAYIDARAKRWTVKLFLSHLWHNSRELEGKPTGTPWITGRGGHSEIIPPPW